jgi:hypothetical protein
MDGEVMTKDKALELALEALESATPKYTRQRKDQRTLGGTLDYWKLEQHQRLKAITAIKQARSAPVQEPVAWRYDLKHAGSFAGVSREYSPIKLSIGENWTPLYTIPPNVATPLAAPVVPDVMTTAEGEHPEYVQGWNDCRQLMLQTRNNK